MSPPLELSSQPFTLPLGYKSTLFLLYLEWSPFPFFFWLHCVAYRTSLTRDQTCSLYGGNSPMVGVLTTGSPGKSMESIFILRSLFPYHNSSWIEFAFPTVTLPGSDVPWHLPGHSLEHTYQHAHILKAKRMKHRRP